MTDLHALGSAAGFALAPTLLFAVLAKIWLVLGNALTGRGAFEDVILRDAAHRWKEQLRELATRQSTYMASAGVFMIFLLTSRLLLTDTWLTQTAPWQTLLICILLVLLTLGFAQRVARLAYRRRHLVIQRDANLAIAHSLRKIVNANNRVFHDVPTGAGIIDHVIVGLHGVYAVYVFVAPCRRADAVRFDGAELTYDPQGTIQSVAAYTSRTRRLSHELSKIAGQRIPVRSVIAVPGLKIASQSTEDYLLVNEITVVMLKGWKDSRLYLLDEQVGKLQDELIQRCLRSGGQLTAA